MKNLKTLEKAPFIMESYWTKEHVISHLYEIPKDGNIPLEGQELELPYLQLGIV